jgi:hypothetical protein
MQDLARTFYRAFFTLSFVCLASGVCALSVAAPAAACSETEQEVSIPLEGGATCIAKDQKDLQKNSIFLLLVTIIRVLAIGVGVGVAIGVTVGGIMIGSARGNANQVQQGIATVRNALIGLLLYIFMFSIINFIIPGGLLT